MFSTFFNRKKDDKIIQVVREEHAKTRAKNEKVQEELKREIRKLQKAYDLNLKGHA